MLKEPIGRLLNKITKDYLGALTHKLDNIDLERHFFAVVVIADSNEKISQKEFAEVLQIDKVTAVKMLDYLSRKDYVVREINIKDRREHFLKLTAKAKRDLPQIREAITELNNTVLNGISEKEIEAFFKCLQNMQAQLNSLKKYPVLVQYKKIK